MHLIIYYSYANCCYFRIKPLYTTESTVYFFLQLQSSEITETVTESHCNWNDIVESECHRVPEK